MTLLPVGHSMGPFHPAPGEPARHHVVRLGWDTPKLFGDVEPAVWAMAAVVPEADLDADVVTALLARGLLVRVTDVTAFAAAHRVQPLLLGAADVGGRHPVGPAGGHPVALLDDGDFEVWAFAHLFPSLLAAAEGFAAAAGTDPAEVLAALVGSLPRLLADDLVYLDVVRDPT